jgi:hypothetical protein
VPFGLKALQMNYLTSINQNIGKISEKYRQNKIKISANENQVLINKTSNRTSKKSKLDYSTYDFNQNMGRSPSKIQNALLP